MILYRYSLLFIVLSLTSCFEDPFNLLRSELDFHVMESEHFVYHYMELDDSSISSWMLYEFPDGSVFDPRDNTQEEAVRLFIDRYEQMYENLYQVFGVEPEGSVHIYLYADADTKAMYGNNVGADAWIDAVSMDGNRYTIHETFYFNSHELVHIFQSCLGSAPLFMYEGMASALGSGPVTYFREIGTGVLGYYYELPTLELPDFPIPIVPYWSTDIDGITYQIPVHRLAAMKLGLRRDADYPLSEDQIYPGLRPSQILSNANVMTRNYDLVYTIASSFIHYLISEYGYSPFIACYKDTSPNLFTGEDVFSIFLKHYGTSLQKLEDDWIDYLESEPADHFTAAVYSSDV